VRGSAAIYGCEPASPLFLREELAGELPLRTRFQRDIAELEAYFANFSRRHPQVASCMLRFQPEIGADLDTPVVRYLSLPVVPTQLGFDPRLQLLHSEDATGALAAAVWSDVRGAVNVAPDGAISLGRILRAVGRPGLPVPHPVFGTALARLADRLGAGPLLEDWVRLLRFGRGVENRRMHDDLGYAPRFDAPGAVADFAERSAARRIGPDLHPGALASRAIGALR
jgi:UDP-glucose 4-epimerase